MYKSKFNYQSLPRQTIDGSRRYVTPDGDRLASVTTILEATKSKESKDALSNWRRRVGPTKAQEITTEAANRGTKMHSFLEYYIKDNELKPEPDNPFHRSSWHMAQQVIAGGLSKCSEFWGIEVPLYYPKIYAGTTDCVGIHDNLESIIDFKQTNKPKKREWIDDYFIQTVFYATAHNELFGTNIKKSVIMMCVKPVVSDTGQITSIPQYQEFILESSDWSRYEQMMWRKIEEYYTKFL